MIASNNGHPAVVNLMKASITIPAIAFLTRSCAVVHPISKLILTQLYGDDNEFVLSLFYKQLYT